MTLAQKILPFISSTDTLIDFGAGQGTQSILFSKSAKHVVAIDKNGPPSNLPKNIEWIIADIPTLSTMPAGNVAFAQNVIQFFDEDYTTKTFIPMLKKQASLVAIRTFYQDPIPPFEKKFKSLYSLQKLKDQFDRWDIEYEFQREDTVPDMKGVSRKFFITDIIAKKKYETN